MICSVMTKLRSRPDSVAAAAVGESRAALVEEVGEADIGDHLGHVVEGERVVTHLFPCPRKGHPGLAWDGKGVPSRREKTLPNEQMGVGPVDGARVAPEWVP